MKLIFWILFLTSCATIPGVTTGDPKPVAKPFKSWPNQAWAEEALATVKREGLDKLTLSDAGLFCEKGMSARNWVHLLGVVASFESGFKPALEYKENFRVAPGKPFVVSTGLFQISLDSTRGGYGCVWAGQKDLHDPLKNIQCTGKVVKKLISQNGAIANHAGTTYRGMARYWSVMRPSGKLAAVKAKLKPFCE